MLLFGHPYINFKPLYHIAEIGDIEHTPPNSTLFLRFEEQNLDLVRHLQHNGLPFALEVESIEELVFAHNFGAKYIVVSAVFAKEAQEVAENYLFDAKILSRLQNEGDLAEKIREGIDGVIYPQAIIKISS